MESIILPPHRETKVDTEGSLLILVENKEMKKAKHSNFSSFSSSPSREFD